VQITFDPYNTVERHFVNTLLASFPASDVATAGLEPSQTQPVVVHNAGIVEASVTSGGFDDDAGGGEAPPAATSGDAPKKRGRKPKAEAVEAVAPSVAESATQAQEEVLPTLDTVRAALQSYTVANGIEAGVGLLKQFGAARVSELAAGEYAAFIKACK
jgi:hypothetical protein